MEEIKTPIDKDRLIDDLIVSITRHLDEISIDNCISRIGSTATTVLNASLCAIFVWDDEEESYPLATVGSDREIIGGLDSHWGREMVLYLKKLEAPYFSDDPHLEVPFPTIENLPSRSIMSYPIVLFGDWMGLVVALRPKDNPFHEDELDLLQPLANLLGVAIPNIYNDSLVELAEICIRFLDEKDPYTHGHSLRVMRYADIIAREYKLPAYARRELKICSLLHDIGKVIIKDSILSKPGKLTDYEFKIMQMHPQIGSNITEKIGKHFADKILYHHERFDGKGYPNGLKGKDIPLISRIIALADAFDAMTSKRSYRDSMGIDIALDEIEKNSGSQFDPELVRCLMKAHKAGRFKIIHA